MTLILPRAPGVRLAATLLLLAAGAQARAAESPPSPGDPAALAAFFDGYLAEHMAADHVAGAVVTVVKDGRLVFARGYGLSDVERGKPVDPGTTLFPVGSMSKVITWTAVMQLAGEGKVDLDADVNGYLDFGIPATYPDAITLRHLMNHASGLEDRKYDCMAASAARLQPLGPWLASHVPARIRPPGRLSAYGNYGAALAGHVLARASGMPFEEVVERRIFSPLGMAHATFRQPLPAAMAGDEAACYRFVNGAFERVQTPLFLPAPAGALRISGADAARFMIAHLGGGPGVPAILEDAALERMHRRSFANDPRSNGLAHGFWELDANGVRVIGHAGSSAFSNSMLLLFPEQRLGVFLATNSEGGNRFVGNDYFPFHQVFMKTFFPPPPPPPPPPAPAPRPGLAARAEGLAGSYGLTMGESASGPEKLYALLVKATVQVEGEELLLRLPDPYGTLRFTEVGEGQFRQVDGGQVLVFRDGEEGVTAAYGPAPETALLRRPSLERLHLPLLAAAMLVLLATAGTGPIGLVVWAVRRGRRPAPPLARAARVAGFLWACLALGVVASAFASLGNVFGLMLGEAPLWPLVRVGSVAAAASAPVLLLAAAAAWRRGWWSLAGRLHYTLLVAAAAWLLWFLHAWNLLGTSLG